MLATLAPTSAWAWGSEGHRVSGIVAQDLLTPKARIRLNELMGGAELADISLYMDINRKELSEKIPGSEKWHYDNQPVCKERAYEQYCPDRNCASARIPEMWATLQDAAAPADKRVMALRFLSHMVGDIHQPLHAADDDDLGANLKFVLIPESPEGRRLHGVWDTDLVKRALRGVSVENYAKSLMKKYGESEIVAWQSGEIRDWMKESHSLSKLVTYGKLPGFECGKEWPSTIVSPVPLPEAYMSDAAATVPLQLAKAGARIAWLLNEALDPADGAAPASAAMAIAKLDNVHRAFVGHWKGALEYRDFTSNERVSLPTELVIGARETASGREAAGEGGAGAGANTGAVSGQQDDGFGGNALSFRYTFEDGPGKTVRTQTAVKFDDKSKIYSAQAESMTASGQLRGKKRDEYKIINGLDSFQKADANPRTLQIEGRGEENGNPVDVRITIKLDGDKLTWLRETREVGRDGDKESGKDAGKKDYLFRHEYKLSRIDSLTPAKTRNWPKATVKAKVPKDALPRDATKDLMNRVNKK